MKKIFALVLSVFLLAGMFLILAVADESADEQFITIFEENFEDYENNVNVSSTLMPNFFVCDYNAIGDGVIHVQETANGNLHLKSHVFTQIYSATPIVGAYEFSLDILEAQGLVQTGVFIRAPKTDAVFYEADGHPDTSTGQAGLFLYVRDAILGVNVKTYDENASSTAFLQNNTVEFSLPEGVTYPYTIRAVDTGAEITLHVNDTLICSVTFSDPGKVYSNHQSKGKFFGTAKLFDAEGKELATYTDPLLSSDASYIGWTTRAADMRVDNISVKAEAAYQTLLAIGKLPTEVTENNVSEAKELAEIARELYNALPEEKKALVNNYSKLTAAEESIDAIENATEPETDESTDKQFITIFEEDFEEYEKDVNVSSTLMPNFFVCDYNAIGDGVIHVQEAANGNLHLKSHVFTQIYSATPIVGAYEFSLDIHEAQGLVQTGVFIRAPKTNSAYYEADGHPDTSTGQAGLFLYVRDANLGVNIKTYDENASGTSYLQNNTINFSLPEGVTYPYTIRVEDTVSEIRIYVNDTLICQVTLSDPGKVYGSHQSEGKFFGTAKLFDAEGKELATYTDPLLSSDASYIGWTTRAADMRVDNITVMAEAAYQTLLAIGKLPTKVTEKNVIEAKELAEIARELYDALPEEKKVLVNNYSKLTAAEESIDAIENATEPETDPVTEPETDPVTEPETVPETDPFTESETQPETEPESNAPNGDTTNAPESEANTDKLSDDTSKSNDKDVDNSLITWILIAIMIVAVLCAAGFIVIKVRK